MAYGLKAHTELTDANFSRQILDNDDEEGPSK